MTIPHRHNPMGITPGGGGELNPDRYAEFNGNVYFNTGVPAAGDLRLVWDFWYKREPAQGSNYWMLGSRDGSTKRFTLVVATGTPRSIRFDIADPYEVAFPVNLPANRTLLDIDSVSGMCFTNGVASGNFSGIPRNFNNGYPLFLGAHNTDGNVSPKEWFLGNIYRCKLWKAGVPVRDFFPLASGETLNGVTAGANGFIDLINNAMYYPVAGTVAVQGSLYI